ncbi:MAG: SulP family inorganic anion transporter [Candidatus Nitrotoga sp.]
MSSIHSSLPKEGIAGLRENFRSDFISGFLVFMLALPLSLGIAKASGFPSAMGVLTAMIGGLFVSFFAGSRLTIKGPAAGLITICAGCVTELGGGPEGWHLALGAIVVASWIQIVLGFLKAGSLSDFIPHSAVHGMLAAIGIIIFAKQVPILLGIDPSTLKGISPIGLMERIPEFVMNANQPVAIIGIISLIILFGMPKIKINLLQKIPAPMIVLLIAVPAAYMLSFNTTQPAHALVYIGDFWGSIGFNADFSAITSFVFWKYVFMFLVVGSLESSLTVKAVDGLDPWKRQSDYNKDLAAVGAGNAVSGLLGGLPMISEVARSSANVRFGGRTVWANFFHGFFLLIAMLLMIPLIEMIPNAALAAMLIFVGYVLASPSLFYKTYKIGSEQLVIFLVTIAATIATDLLIGIASGIIVKFLFHIINGAPLRSMFKARYTLKENESGYHLVIHGSAIFSNLMGFKKAFNRLNAGKKVEVDFSKAKLVDHTFMEFLKHFEEEYTHSGGTVIVNGFERFQSFSNHPLAGRKVSKGYRQIEEEPTQVKGPLVVNGFGRTQLALLFGMLCALPLLIVGMGKTGQELKVVQQDRSIPLEQVAHIELLLLENRLAIATILVTPTPEIISHNTTLIEENIAEIGKTWEAYLTNHLSPAERALAEKFAANRNRLIQEGLVPALVALREDDVKKANNIVVRKVRPLYQPVGSDIHALVKLQQADFIAYQNKKKT